MACRFFAVSKMFQWVIIAVDKK